MLKRIVSMTTITVYDDGTVDTTTSRPTNTTSQPIKKPEQSDRSKVIDCWTICFPHVDMPEDFYNDLEDNIRRFGLRKMKIAVASACSAYDRGLIYYRDSGLSPYLNAIIRNYKHGICYEAPEGYKHLME